MSDVASTRQQRAVSATRPRTSRWHRAIYGVALALAIALIVFFGWAGFWLGVSVVVLARVGVWAVPLVKLSYAEDGAATRSRGR